MPWPGEALVIRLWETLTEKGIGSLLKPRQMKREGIAQIELRRAEILALAQVEKDLESGRPGIYCRSSRITWLYGRWTNL